MQQPAHWWNHLPDDYYRHAVPTHLDPKFPLKVHGSAAMDRVLRTGLAAIESLSALARALVHGPRNVLLDEPTNGLDVMAVRNLRVLLRRLRDAGHCVLFSSHVMQEVSALCDVVIVLARGAVVARGTPDELRERTGCASLEDAFVQLIGSDEGLG